LGSCLGSLVDLFIGSLLIYWLMYLLIFFC
jgi:hypothetical protein